MRKVEGTRTPKQSELSELQTGDIILTKEGVKVFHRFSDGQDRVALAYRDYSNGRNVERFYDVSDIALLEFGCITLGKHSANIYGSGVNTLVTEALDN